MSCGSMNATPHVAQNTNGRSSAINRRTTRHAGYDRSQRVRKRTEEAFGWMKTISGQEKTKFRGRDRVGWAFTFAAAAYNLGAVAQAPAGNRRMSAPAGCKLIGRWRIVEADIGDRACLNLSGQIVFGAPPSRPRHRIKPVPDWIHCQGLDEMDKVSGDGSAELLDDGTIEGEFAYHNGDEALLKASGRAICGALRRRLAQTGPIEPAA
jgi:hypothetical protein